MTVSKNFWSIDCDMDFNINLEASPAKALGKRALKEFNNVWTETQDLYLIRQAHTLPKFVWSMLNNDRNVSLRTPQRCRIRYLEIARNVDYLRNLLLKSGWSKEENHLLEKFARELNNAWDEIAKKLNKEAQSCENQFCLLKVVRLNNASLLDCGDEQGLINSNSSESNTAIKQKKMSSTGEVSLSLWPKKQDLYLIHQVHAFTDFTWGMLDRDKHLSHRSEGACRAHYAQITADSRYMSELLSESGWTDLENLRLEDLAVEKNKAWSSIAEELKKEPIECEKQWCLLQAARVNNKTARSWSKKEDIYLIHQVLSIPNFVWRMLDNDKNLSHRSEHLCRARYNQITADCDHMSQLLSESGWSKAENLRLENLAIEKNNAWNPIASELNKEAFECEQQWCLLQAARMNPNTASNWSREEDLYLIHQVHSVPNFVWRMLNNDKNLPKKAVFMCQLRYLQITGNTAYTAKLLAESGWSSNDNLRLETLIREKGKAWSVIGEALKKGAFQCEMQWCLLQAARIHNTWSKEQDFYLMQQVHTSPQFIWHQLDGDPNLSKQTWGACRSRYYFLINKRNYLRELLVESGWTKAENLALETLARQKNNAWDEIAKELNQGALACAKQWSLLQTMRIKHPEQLASAAETTKTLGKRAFEEVKWTKHQFFEWTDEQDLYLIYQVHRRPDFVGSMLDRDENLGFRSHSCCTLRYRRITNDGAHMSHLLTAAGWTYSQNQRLEELVKAMPIKKDWAVAAKELDKEALACEKQWCLLQAVRAKHPELLARPKRLHLIFKAPAVEAPAPAALEETPVPQENPSFDPSTFLTFS